MSIGEEQSDSTVTAITWSPPGLSRHQRPALAVLTTNHLLSLWASASDIEDHSTWRRVLIFNDFNLTVQRICCMAWAPSLPSSKLGVGCRQRKCGVQILAIALDDGRMRFFRVSGPSTSEARGWQYKKLCDLDSKSKVSRSVLDDINGSLSLKEHTRYSLFGNAMATSHLVESITLGPWTHNCNGIETTITFRTRGGARHMWLFRMDDETAQGHIELFEYVFPSYF